MAKDAYWFKHDSNARNDIKILQLRAIYGWEGYGVYFAIIEWLREQDKHRLLYSDSSINIIAFTMNSDFTRIKNIINDCIRLKLFIVRGEFFMSDSLIDRMKNWETKKRNGSETKAKRKRNRSEIEAKSDIREEEIREDKSTGGVSFSEPHKLFSLEAPSSKKETWVESFGVFWSEYPKRKAKGDAERAWKKIPHELVETVLNATKTLKTRWAGKDMQFCPYPASWLNAKGWEDEDLTPTTQETKEEERKRKEREFLDRL